MYIFFYYRYLYTLDDIGVSQPDQTVEISFLFIAKYKFYKSHSRAFAIVIWLKTSIVKTFNLVLYELITLQKRNIVWTLFCYVHSGPNVKVILMKASIVKV